MRTFALFGAKKFGFFEIYGVSYGQEGGVNFSQFCADVFYERPLTNVGFEALTRLKCNEVKLICSFINSLQLCSVQFNTEMGTDPERTRSPATYFGSGFEF